MGYIYLVSLGEVKKGLLEFLAKALKEKFGLETKIATNFELSPDAYNKERKQYHSTPILNELKKVLPRLPRELGERARPKDSFKTLGITSVDLYVPSLNFVFGEAEIEGRCALISLNRLYPEFYGLSPNQEILRERALKEAVHELGHTFGLTHCPDTRCVMHFSNSLKDTDIKGKNPCSNCQRTLKEKLEID